MMWRAQLSAEGRSGLYEAITFTRVWQSGRRDVRLRRDDGTFSPPPADIYWANNIPPGRPDRAAIISWITDSAQNTQRRANFTCGISEAAMTHALQPLGAVAYVFINLTEDRTLSAANALITAVVEPYTNPGKAGSAYRDLAQVIQALAETSSLEGDYGIYLKTALNVLLSAVEQGTAPAALLEPIAPIMAKKNPGDRQPADLLIRLDRLSPGHGPGARHGQDNAKDSGPAEYKEK
jgi:hypothetical protein